MQARRAASNIIREDGVMHKLFTEMAERYKERAGGYTRVLRTRQRQHDGAQLAYIECAPSPCPRFSLISLRASRPRVCRVCVRLGEACLPLSHTSVGFGPMPSLICIFCLQAVASLAGAVPLHDAEWRYIPPMVPFFQWSIRVWFFSYAFSRQGILAVSVQPIQRILNRSILLAG